MKKCTLLSVELLMIILLAGCGETSGESAESDSVQESEIAAVEAEMTDMAKEEEPVEESLPTWDDYELNGERWMDRDFTVKDDSDIEGQEGKISNIYIYDDNEESGEQETPVPEVYLSYPSVTEGLLPVAVTTEGEFCVDLSVNPELWKLVEKDRAVYEEFRVNFTATDYIHRADSYVYSYFCIGGNGEEIDYRGFNYHVESGKELTLEDVVKDKDALIEALAEKLYGLLSSGNPENLAATLCEANSRAWNIGYQGLTFYVDASLIGGDENQYFPVMVTFAAYPDLFREECMQVPKAYAVAEDIYIPTAFMYDLNEDGTPEKISILDEVGNRGIEKLIIQVGDLEKTIETRKELIDEDLSWRDLRCHILHLGDGKNFIYLHTNYWLDGLYYGIILSVSDSEIVVLNDEAGWGVEDNPLIDPCNIVYSQFDWLFDLGSKLHSIISCKQVDENGQAHDNTDVDYYMPSRSGFVTNNAFLADRIDRDNADVILVSQDLVPSNRKLVPYRQIWIDGEVFVDFMDMQDGKVYRGMVDIQWEHDGGTEVRINGSLVK